MQGGGNFNGVELELQGEVDGALQDFIGGGGGEIVKRTDDADATGLGVADEVLHVDGAAQFDVDEGGEVEAGMQHFATLIGAEVVVAAFLGMAGGEQEGKRQPGGERSKFFGGEVQRIEAQFEQVAAFMWIGCFGKFLQELTGVDDADNEWLVAEQEVLGGNKLWHG